MMKFFVAVSGFFFLSVLGSSKIAVLRDDNDDGSLQRSSSADPVLAPRAVVGTVSPTAQNEVRSIFDSAIANISDTSSMVVMKPNSMVDLDSADKVEVAPDTENDEIDESHRNLSISDEHRNNLLTDLIQPDPPSRSATVLTEAQFDKMAKKMGTDDFARNDRRFGVAGKSSRGNINEAGIQWQSHRPKRRSLGKILISSVERCIYALPPLILFGSAITFLYFIFLHYFVHRPPWREEEPLAMENSTHPQNTTTEDTSNRYL